MKKLLLMIVITNSILITCAATKMKMTLQNQTNKNSIDIAKSVLIENDYILNEITDEIIITEKKQKNISGLAIYYRWRAVINVIDEKNFILNLPTETRIGNEQIWSPVEKFNADAASGIINPLIESFKKRGVVLKIAQES